MNDPPRVNDPLVTDSLGKIDYGRVKWPLQLVSTKMLTAVTQVQKGIVKSIQKEKKIVQIFVKKKKKNQQSYVHCAQIKVLGLHLIPTHL